MFLRCEVRIFAIKFFSSHYYFYGTEGNFFSSYSCIVNPADNVRPLIVTLTNGGTQWLLGNNFRKDFMIVGIRESGTRCCQPGGISCVNVTTAGQIGGACFRVFLDSHRFIAHFVSTEEVSQVQFGSVVTRLHATHIPTSSVAP